MIKWIDTLSDPAANLVGSAIGIFGGLVAILLGALLNAHLNRARDDRVQKQKANNLARALSEELETVHKTLLANQKILTKSLLSPQVGFDIALRANIYPSVISEIGLLEAKYIGPVIWAHGLIHEYSKNLISMGAIHKPDSDGSNIYSVSGTAVKKVLEYHSEITDNLRETIDTLKSNLN